MQQGRQGRAAELKARSPSTRHVAEPDCQQQQDGDRREHDGQQRVEDRLAGDRAADRELLLHVHRAQPAGEVALDARELVLVQHRVAEDVAASRLDHLAVQALGVHHSLDLLQGRMVGESDSQLRATREVDAEREVPGGHRDDAGDDDQQRDREEDVAQADDVQAADAWLGGGGRSACGGRLGLRCAVGDDVGLLFLRADVRQLGHDLLRATPVA